MVQTSGLKCLGSLQPQVHIPALLHLEVDKLISEPFTFR